MSGRVSRRRFLSASGTALAGLAVAARPRAAQSAIRTGTMPGGDRKAVKLGMVKIDGSLADKFALLKRLGFDGVELDSPNDLDRDEVLSARDATGLVIHGVVDSAHWQRPLSDPSESVRAEGVAALETALRDARAYGATTVLLVPAVVSKQVSYAAAWERSQVEIRRVLPLCDELEVSIAFENVWNNFLLSPLEMARFIDEFESSRVGAYLDVGNLARFGWPEHWVEALGPRILKVDVKGYSRKLQNEKGPWAGFGVEILDGDVDWPAVRRALRATGFSGWFTAEVRGGGEDRLRDLAERMDRILAL